METGKRQRRSRSRIACTCACFLAVLTIATTSAVGTHLYAYTPKSDCEISLYEGQQIAKKYNSNEGALSSETIGNSEISSQSQTTAQDQTDPQEPKPIAGSRSAVKRSLPSQPVTKNQKPDSRYFHVEDAEQIWTTETSVDLFQKNYKGQDGNITISSSDSQKVIAPGSEGSYTFTLKNTGSQTADYKVWVETDISPNLSGAELETRMSGQTGWLLGGSGTWKAISDLDGVSEESHLAAGKSTDYTISWQWPFEQNEDAHDTEMGNLAATEDLTCTVTIHTVATGDTGHHSGSSGDEETGIAQNPFPLSSVQTGDTNQILLWIVLAVASAGVILFLLYSRKKGEEDVYETKE